MDCLICCETIKKSSYRSSRPSACRHFDSICKDCKHKLTKNECPYCMMTWDIIYGPTPSESLKYWKFENDNYRKERNLSETMKKVRFHDGLKLLNQIYLLRENHEKDIEIIKEKQRQYIYKLHLKRELSIWVLQEKLDFDDFQFDVILNSMVHTGKTCWFKNDFYDIICDIMF